MIEIDVKVIRDRINTILDYVISEGLDSFHLDSSMYWATPLDIEHQFDDPPELNVGDLEFDVQLVSKIGQPLAWELTYFPQILIAIAQAGAKKGL